MNHRLRTAHFALRTRAPGMLLLAGIGSLVRSAQYAVRSTQ